jgi:pimeloyl-ACP methyl ester carboxylesterase
VRGLVIVDSRPAIPAERLEGLRTRGRRALRGYATAEEAVASFRLLPPDTVADPALLRHLAEQGIVQRDAGWAYRFDPASYGARRPVDGWQLLSRIEAPTLIVRGEHSPILPRDTAERMRDTVPKARLVEIAAAHHHVTLDQPEAFARVLAEFLETLPVL